MAGMDLSIRRADRGISVFWLILAMGAGVFILLAILLLSTEAQEEAEYGGEPVIIESEGETTLNGNATSAGQAAEGIGGGDDAAAFVDGEVADEAPTPEGDLSTEAIEMDVEPAAPSDGEVEAGATAIEGDAIDEAPGEVAGEAEGDNEIVVDPDGTTAPVVPTDSGPEGSDGSALTQD